MVWIPAASEDFDQILNEGHWRLLQILGHLLGPSGNQRGPIKLWTQPPEALDWIPAALEDFDQILNRGHFRFWDTSVVLLVIYSNLASLFIDP